MPFFVLALSCVAGQAQLNADFTTDKEGGCSPLTITFTNTTTGASVAATYSWDLGNGNTSTPAKTNMNMNGVMQKCLGTLATAQGYVKRPKH